VGNTSYYFFLPLPHEVRLFAEPCHALERIDQAPDATVADPPKPRYRKPQVRSNITIGEIVDRTERAGFGFTIALLALVAIPFAGLSTPFGLVISFLGLQMIAGHGHPWLPRRVRQHAVTKKTLDWLGCRLARWTARLERWVRLRWTVVIHPPFFAAVGVGILLQGLGLALPLPIPGSNWVFIIPILIYAIGLLEDDGLLVLLGHASTVAMIVLGCIFWHVIRDNLVQAFAWLQRLA